MQAGPLLSLSPSFTTTYSSSGTRNLAEIAARVVNEFRQENGSNDAVFGFEDDDDVAPWEFAKEDQSRSLTNTTLPDDHEEEEEEEGEESEFEFAFVSTEPDSSPISADEIFHNGLIKPVYPLFDQTLLLSGANNPNDVVAKKESDKTTRRRQPLRKLMVEEEERETTSSSLSSEAADVDGLKQGTFCVWKPKSDAGEGAGGCRKKNGSSMRWKIRDILSRSRSVGKEGFVFVAPTKKVAGGGKRGFRSAGKVEAVAEKEKEKEKEKDDVVLGETDDGERGVKSKEEDKKRSFLPYKQDLVGFLANVNGLSRNLHPF